MKNLLTRLNQIFRCLSRASLPLVVGRRAGLALLLAIASFTSQGQSNQCANLPTGLIGWWAAEGDAGDFTGAHSGSFPYGSAFAAGVVGQAFDFDASLRRVSIADSPAFQLTNAMTLEAWVYPRAYGGFITFRGDNRPGLDNWTVDTYESGFVKFSLIDPVNNVASVRAPLALNQWQHIAATWDHATGDLKIYVNGVLGGQTNSSLVPIGALDAGSEPAIGIGNHGGTFHQFPFNGLIDELGIYGRALTANEVAVIFMANSAGKCISTNPPSGNCAVAPEGVVSWWRADGSAQDAVASNHGTPTSGTPISSVGFSGQAFQFNGQGDKIELNDPPSLRLTNAFTIEAWILASNAPAGGHAQIFFRGDMRGCFDPYYLSLQPDRSIRLHVGAEDPLNPCGVDLESPAIILNEWKHVAGVFDGDAGKMRIYVDGALAAEMNTSVRPFAELDPSANPGVAIGNHSRGFSDQGFTGLIDELAVYGRALAANEIAAIYHAGSLGKCSNPNPPASNCVTTPSGLLAWWSAESNSLDRIGASVASFDPATYSVGKVGTAFDFNGANNVVVPDQPSFNPTNAITIEGWVYPRALTTSYAQDLISKDGEFSGPRQYMLTMGPPPGLDNGTGGFRAHVGVPGGFYFIDGATKVQTTNWYHVAMTYDGSALKLFVNGNLDAQLAVTGPIIISSQPIRIGGGAPGGDPAYHFNGLLDELSIYHRALAPTEIQSIYAADQAGKCPPLTQSPVITQQPQSATVIAGATAQLDVVASGVPAPSYQWYFDGNPLVDQTNAALILSNVQLTQDGTYAVRVFNPSGSVMSSNATLTVMVTQAVMLVEGNTPGFYNDALGTILDGTAPQFPLPFGAGGGDPEFYPADEPNLAAGAAILGNWLTNPASLNSYWRSVTSIPTTWELNTETAIIYVVDGGHHGVSNLRADIDADNGIYVWVNGKYKFGARQPGLPSPLGQYEYTNVYLGELAPGSNYIQILREDSGIADGYQFRLSGTVLATNQSPIITQSPATQTAIGGNAVTFHAAAIGSPGLKFQWQFNGVALPGQSNTSLTLANVLLSQAGEYTFVATNPYGVATSAVASLTVLAFPPVITRQPTNTTVIVGNTATLSVQATGSVTLAYQWWRDGSPLAGRTSTSLPFQNIQFSNAGNYSVIVTNPYGAATSSVAVLTVNPIPSCVAVHDGLVSWWKGENNALDNWDSNNGNNQFVNTTTLGKVGRAFSGPFINVNDSPSLRVTNGLTLEAWINPSTLSGVRVLVSKFDYPLFQPGVSQSAYLLGTTNNGALFFTLTPNGSVRTNTTLVTTNLIPLNQWTHVAATYDGSVMRLYFNGSQIGQTNYTGKIFPGGVPLGIGGFAGSSFQTSSPWQYSGLMDEVSLYNRALSAAEIQSIVNADLTGKCLALPVITQQPQSQAVPLGEDVKLTATVVGSRPLTYRWKFDDTNILNATNAFLVIEKIKANHTGLYTVAVSNSIGFDLSAAAQITLLPAPACTEILPGLISWWPGDANPLDAMGLNHISTYTPASYPTGKVATAFTFNGVSSRIAINNSASLNFGANTNFSIEMWIKANVTNALNLNVPLMEKRDTLSSGWKGYSLSLYRGQLAFALGAASVSTNALYVSSGPDLRDGMFHHVAVTLNRATTNGGVLYVDGAPVLVFDSRVLTNSLVTPGPLYIGGPATTFSNSYFTGMIDEPAIYNRALTAAEILSIRTAGAAGRCKAAPIILTQPVGGAVALGSDYTLVVVATGIPAPRYQWRKGTTPMAGATNATFILTNFSAANAGSYSVAVTNVFGSVISSNAVVGRNFLPIANADALTTPSNTPAVFPAAKLTLNDSDLDGDPLTVTTVSTNSAQNGTVSLVSGMVTYSPPANFVGNDTFTYTVGDGRGGTAVGTVMATVGNGGAVPLNIVFGPTVDGGQFVVRFAGIPGLTYTIQAAPTPNGPWIKVANLAAPSTDTGLGIGVFEFREAVAGESARFYRTIYPSY